MPRLLIFLMIVFVSVGCNHFNVKESARPRTFDLYSERGYSDFGSGRSGRSSYKEWIIGASMGWEFRYDDEKDTYRTRKDKRVRLIAPLIREEGNIDVKDD